MRAFVLLAAVAALAPVRSAAAQANQPPTWEQATARQWKALHDKILTMAKDAQFPDAKLETRPHPDSRTVLDEFRHVTIGLEMSTAQLTGQPFDYQAREKADENKPRTRASVVAEMEAAIAASYPAVETKANARLLFWLEHQAEHYGKLVSDYRLAGIVPPVSRPR
ncbi:MAG: DinB family protein [Gemmatimonadales bacterium]